MNAGNHPPLPLADVAFDAAAFLAHWVPDDPWQPDPETAHYYEVKAQIAATLKPERVAEIGVRAGYSALAFHMGHPYTEFYGLDMDEGGWGGQHCYLPLAAERLHALPNLRAVLEQGDSQKLRILPPEGKDADLFHIDGDHTPKGTAHDILLALYNGARYIVVDDYDYIPYVAEGADWAIEYCKLDAWYVGDGGYRGNVVIARRAA